MDFQKLELPDVMVVSPKRHADSRGFFSEVFRDDAFRKQLPDVAFVQDNHVYSRARGTLRGLHFQTDPHAQGKLVRCGSGRILDVAVDIRVGSPTYGRHVAVELSRDNWKQLWVPPGFAHGYVTLTDDCEVSYKVTDYYAPQCDRGILWNDPRLGIDWGLPPDRIILSDKDSNLPCLSDVGPFFHFGH
ncbi:MAG: dTDP-4-dehydrorhamnose 3,5-epimerase [Xanthobacteraceae bacterium]|nr:dTDP-4-dehydrorhamnose 3,5-epimerase [Xanthobacteraceae bacterium]